MNENEYINKLLELRDRVNEAREKSEIEYNELQKWIDKEICYTEVKIEDRAKEAEAHDEELKERFWLGSVA